ncbi:MAG: hypothetical protein HY904_05930 [Deltaproteobacteria bacterium]|nr:hypothetical protein [Deltaproteobacteria bacterium]
MPINLPFPSLPSFPLPPSFPGIRPHSTFPDNDPIAFPHDEGVHPHMKTEWWYLNGHLGGTRGEQFDFFCALAHLPNVLTVKANPDHWKVPLPVPDLMGATAWDGGLTSRRAGATGPGHHWIRQVRPYVVPWSPQCNHGLLPERLDVNFPTWQGPVARMKRMDNQHIAADVPFGPNARLVLELTQSLQMPPLLVGGQGTIDMGPKGRSRYYSLPSLQAHGTVNENGNVAVVDGTVWMDHQWGDMAFFDGWTHWKWFGVQLDGGTEIVTFAFWNDRGHVQSNASMLLPDGRSEHLVATADKAPVLRVTDDASRWESPRTHVKWPLKCSIDIPPWNLKLDVEPVAQDQEVPGSGPHGFITPGPFFPNYWEGGVTVKGQLDGKPVTGKAYEEMLGYYADNDRALPAPATVLGDMAAALSRWLVDAKTDIHGHIWS